MRHCPVFWLKWPVHDLVLVTPPPPLIKVASNTRPCSKLGGTTLNGREVSILSHRPVTSSDLKQERLCFLESVSTFLQLVVASQPDSVSVCHSNTQLASYINFVPNQYARRRVGSKSLTQPFSQNYSVDPWYDIQSIYSNKLSFRTQIYLIQITF